MFVASTSPVGRCIRLQVDKVEILRKIVKKEGQGKIGIMTASIFTITTTI